MGITVLLADCFSPMARWGLRATGVRSREGILVRAAGVACAWLALGGGFAVAERMPLLRQCIERSWVSFGLVSGRLVVLCPQEASLPPRQSTGFGRKETASFEVNGGEGKFHYELKVASQEITLDAGGDNEVLIRRTPAKDSPLPPFAFQQKGDEPLVFRVGAAGQEQVYEAADLWRLYLCDPAAFGEHLRPVLREVLSRRDNPLDRLEEFEKALLGAPPARPPDRQRWRALVDQLGDGEYRKRVRAEQALREIGPTVVPYLQRLDPSRLDAEQQYRIRRIAADFAAKDAGADVKTMAQSLAADPSVWTAILSQPDESKRRLAAERLRALLGEAVEFDPAGSPATRARQLQQLRRQLREP